MWVMGVLCSAQCIAWPVGLSLVSMLSGIRGNICSPAEHRYVLCVWLGVQETASPRYAVRDEGGR